VSLGKKGQFHFDNVTFFYFLVHFLHYKKINYDVTGFLSLFVLNN